MSTGDRLRTAFTATAAILLLMAAGCTPRDPMAQQTFGNPEEAFQALAGAIERSDLDEILDILGRAHEDRLVTPDWEAEEPIRQQIAAAAREQSELVEVEDGEIQLVIGAQEWPFPFPVVRGEDGSWRFDTEEGIEVVIDRRVGRNELFAIQLLDAYVDAQIAYAKEDRDGDELLEYAQRLASTPGNRDGLYWEARDDEEESPFGPLVEGAESYLEGREAGDPFHGYLFRVLTRQGENPAGGRRDYVVDGNMIAGFGLVAYPADYGVSGVMTFVVSHRGRIHQKDLGAFAGMEEYDPDDTWTEVSVDSAE